jgi:hypothetical protein
MRPNGFNPYSPSCAKDPASGARCLALAAHVRGLPEIALHQLLAGLPRERFDRLVESAYRPEGSAA